MNGLSFYNHMSCFLSNHWVKLVRFSQLLYGAESKSPMAIVAHSYDKGHDIIRQISSVFISSLPINDYVLDELRMRQSFIKTIQFDDSTAFL